MTELKHTTAVQRSITSENRHKIWLPHGLLKLSKKRFKSRENIYSISFEAN